MNKNFFKSYPIACQLSVGNILLKNEDVVNQLPIDKSHKKRFKNQKITVIRNELPDSLKNHIFSVYDFVPVGVIVFVHNPDLSSNQNELGYYSFISSDFSYTLRKLIKLVGSKKNVTVLKKSLKQEFFVRIEDKSKGQLNGEIYSDLVHAEDYYVSNAKKGYICNLYITNPLKKVL